MSLKQDIRELEHHLGPLVNYSSDHIPWHQPERYLMKYLYTLKERYYAELKRPRTKRNRLFLVQI
jgi:hypothetical protein